MSLILIVDDNELNVELARDLLEIEGFEVEVAFSGEEGVEKASAIDPDLILMDLRMPGMSGLEAMQVLKDQDSTRDIPVVALTASAMKGDAERLLAAGFDAYLQKPIDPGSFHASVNRLIHGRESGFPADS